MKKLFARFRTPLLFTLCLLPIAAVGGYFTGIYSFNSYPADMQAQILEQIGSVELLAAVTAVQTIGYAVFCGFFGCILARKLGLLRPFKLSVKPALVTIIAGVIGGGLFSLDYWVFGRAIPEVAASYALKPDATTFIASLAYGGVIEEVMLRLFTMSLIAFVLWKLFARKREQVPTGVLVAANVISALLFAASHLPATAIMLGITPLILVRCFALNGGAGLLFGRLYRKYGIVYAMAAHAIFHIVSKIVWLLFIG